MTQAASLGFFFWKNKPAIFLFLTIYKSLRISYTYTVKRKDHLKERKGEQECTKQ